MDKLYSVKDVCERYQFKDARTARKVMRDMVHMENPLMVSERALMEWEQRKTLPPESVTRQLTRKGVKRRACR